MGSQVSKSAPLSSNTTSDTFVEADEKAIFARRHATQSTAQRLTASSQSTTPSLTASKLAKWEADFEDTPTLKLSQLLLTNADPTQTLVTRASQIADQQVFNLELKGIKGSDGKDKKGVYPGPVTNQKNSGRCWLFATTNVLRYRIISKLNLGDFQLSQSYLFFYDKLERCNYYLENMIDLVDEPMDSRLVWHINGDPISDGGQFDMAVNLLEKYGCVPQTLYPESYSSSASSKMDQLLVMKLREYNCELRALNSSLDADNVSPAHAVDAMRLRKDEMMKSVYDILCICLGTPPKADEKLSWEYYDRDGKFCKMEVSPSEFYHKYTGPHMAGDSFSLINDPRNKYDTLYSVDRLGNVWGGRPVQYVNAPSKALEEAVIECIKADQPVFFGCDVGAFLVRDSGIMDTKAYDYELAFGTKLGMTKTERLQTAASAMTHAMVITAVHVDDKGNAVRYKVENSWSDAAGQKGWFMMTADWFNQYTYQVVIPKKLSASKYVEILESGHAEVLPAWDPMGALAK